MSDTSVGFEASGLATPTSDEFAEYLKEMADDLSGQALDEGTFEPADTLNADSPHTLQRRKLLNILNKLHRTGVQQDIDLPQIVVIGSQSVGKSSLIEAMSGITLPRDSGTCTRCPMECKLTYSPESWKCSIFLRFQVDNWGKPLAKVLETQFGKTLTDKDEVAGMLRRAQRAILRPALNSKLFLDDTDQDILEPAPLSFSANCVCLRVSGPQVPDLFFYDLPGIIANVGEKGDPRDIELIRNLVKKYISKERCLVLLTVSCETDFENQGAVMLAKQYDRHGKRIIGVLTKPDRIEQTGGGRWLAMIRNEENELENGWFAVKLPSPSELLDKITWEEARTREMAFFQEKKPWNTISPPHSSRLGSRQLAGNLSCLLSKLFAQRLPQIEKELRLAYGNVEKELAGLPAPVYEDTSATVTGLVFKFCQEISRRIEGTVQFPDMQPGLMQSVHQAHAKFKTDIRNTAPKFCPWEKAVGVVALPTVSLIPGKKKKALVPPVPEAPPPSLSPQPPSPSLLSETQRTNWVKDPEFIAIEEHSSNFCDRVGSTFYLDEVMKAAEESISRELPGDYPFSVKEELIKLFVKEWREPMLNCFNSIASLLKNHINDVITEYFGPYVHGGLLATVKTIVNTLLLKLQRSTLAKLDGHLAREGQPFTLNASYFNHFKANFLTYYRDIRRQSQGRDSLIARLKQQDNHVNSSVQYLNYLGYGFNVTANDLTRLIPADPLEPALEIMATVRAYFQVSYKRFLDAIPMEIDTEFIRGFDSQIREGLILGLQVGSQTKCEKWLSEPLAIVAKRKELEATKQRLLDARKELAALALGNSEDWM